MHTPVCLLQTCDQTWHGKTIHSKLPCCRIWSNIRTAHNEWFMFMIINLVYTFGTFYVKNVLYGYIVAISTEKGTILEFECDFISFMRHTLLIISQKCTLCRDTCDKIITRVILLIWWLLLPRLAGLLLIDGRS